MFHLLNHLAAPQQCPAIRALNISFQQLKALMFCREANMPEASVGGAGRDILLVCGFHGRIYLGIGGVTWRPIFLN
jgi:hypothetical protein